MADYKSDQIKGWQRSKGVTIKNELGEVPSISFIEELVVQDANGSILFKEDAGSLYEELSDPSITFPMLNPADDSNVGTGSYGQAYALLYSLYRFLADKRDTTEV